MMRGLLGMPVMLCCLSTVCDLPLAYLEARKHSKNYRLKARVFV